MLAPILLDALDTPLCKMLPEGAAVPWSQVHQAARLVGMKMPGEGGGDSGGQSMDTCIYIYIYTYTYIYVYIYLYMYIHIHI